MAKDKKTPIADKILKRKKDPALQKQLQSEQIDFDANDEIIEIVKKSKVQTKTKSKQKRRNRLIIAGIVVLMLAPLIHWLFKPAKAGMRFGYCKVFLELHVEYPEHLRLSQIEGRRDFIRIWYMQKDSFGQDRFENIECYQARDENGVAYFKNIRVNRRDLDPEKIERFNTSLSTIRAYPPDLTYPRRLRDALGNIDIQTYLFRKKIL